MEESDAALSIRLLIWIDSNEEAIVKNFVKNGGYTMSVRYPPPLSLSLSQEICRSLVRKAKFPLYNSL